MSLTDDNRSQTKFYQEDIVQHNARPNVYGVVQRCWHDAEDYPPVASPSDPLLRPLKRGEVGVSFFPDHLRDILSESDFTLVDRLFEPGHLCKRSVEDMQSGIVVGVDVRLKAQHAISGVLIDEWKTVDDLDMVMDVSVGDYVTYNHWIGQVQGMFDESIVEIADGQLVRLPEISARLTVGDKGSDILPAPVPNSQGIFAFFMRNARPSQADTVVAVKHTVLAVAWMAVDQSLTPAEAAGRQRPPRFWHSDDLNKLTLLRGLSDRIVRVGDKVTLKSTPPELITKHGRDDELSGTIKVAHCMVKETQTTVKVLWQDGTVDTLKSTELIPYLNPDEYDCWPGDHVVWKNEDGKRPAVVQSVNATERTASILLPDSTCELASVLELDPHGSDPNLGNAPEAFGVRRGDYVFIHREGTTNGCEVPKVPRIGELEEWAREPPFVEEDGQLGGWRRELDTIGSQIAQARGKELLDDGAVHRPSKDSRSFNWFGEVLNLRLDGLIEVYLPDDSVAVVPLQRLTRLHDGLEQLEDMWNEGFSDSQSFEGEYEGEDVHHHHHHHHHQGEGAVEIQYDDGTWQAYDGDDGDDWEEESADGETDDSSMDVDDQTTIQTPPQSVTTPATVAGLAMPIISPTTSADQTPTSRLSPSFEPREDEPKDNERVVTNEEKEDDSPWKRFSILESAPVDHAFYGTPPAQPSKPFLGRLSKEYRVLSSSLPESIIVRAYEDRTDLLRSLIIGPENTPYEDAPFVIDWMLDSNFPQSPPIAHFLSWTNGNGRVNPNLYEEGKVCLSILGTWAGDRSESWSAARSSLLQAFVSIQGLVLVKEPWFCEPAYEKLRGTEEGMVNSRLYSEKAYVLSRGFVRRALEIPLGGLEEEMNEIYFSFGRLEKVIRTARRLIEKSKLPSRDGEEDKESAVPRLTAGGMITLTRTLDKLEAIRRAPPQLSTHS
ncbi:hypothetical protein BD410DRAFT_782087 [Rickenella mellea]|uniref:UBC core domain-containing protein n=1 Tax=Rickenella mellea TaxID=50990 RepID=A0A4Y7QM31_9AGAM|nr:hypothetical protein BD410DRAFT_782087 [Rickenella mellea]